MKDDAAHTAYERSKYSPPPEHDDDEDLRDWGADEESDYQHEHYTE